MHVSRRGCGLGLAHLQEAGLPLPAGEVLQLVGQQCSLQVRDGRLADRLAAVTAHPSHPLREGERWVGDVWKKAIQHSLVTVWEKNL